MKRGILLLASLTLAAAVTEDGYRGIWYFNQPSQDEFKYKYSGGFAVYPQQHAPFAIYSKEADKTFFCYGGSAKGRHDELLHMVSYFDHATGTVPRPTLLLNKKTSDAHDNPTISIDGDGHIWIFSSAHGTSRPSFIHRSRKPYSIDDFEFVLETNFSYTQPWHLPGQGFLFLHTRYQRIPESRSSGRALYWMTSPDGRAWSEPQRLAFALWGHYQVSWPHEERIGTAFDIHPPPLGLNERTNLYYLETRDFGQTWTTAAGKPVPLPVSDEHSAALVRDFRREGLLIYLKDLQFDAAGRPVLLYLTSKGYESGPKNGPRLLHTARWTGTTWEHRTVAPTDHNYDHGSLYLEKGLWRFIGPTGRGPQAYGTGGEIELWESRDEGKSWRRTRQMTRNSRYNHTYVRRPLNAHPGFYAIWADGDAFAPSESRLYFANHAGDVFVLPAEMQGPQVRPESVNATASSSNPPRP